MRGLFRRLVRRLRARGPVDLHEALLAETVTSHPPPSPAPDYNPIHGANKISAGAITENRIGAGAVTENKIPGPVFGC